MIPRFLLALLLVLPITASAATARELVARSIADINGGKGVEVKLAVDAKPIKLLMKGKLFNLDAGQIKIWYDGKDMWTYNEAIGETTLSSPSTQELAEVNPFIILRNAMTGYNMAYAKKHPVGMKLVVMTPKNLSSGIARIVLTISSKNAQLKRIAVTPKGGRRIVAKVEDIAHRSSLSQNFFRYSSKSYKGVKLLDLR